jgi:hypothetical protein
MYGAAVHISHEGRMQRYIWAIAGAVVVVVAVIVVEMSLRGQGAPKNLGDLTLVQTVTGGDARAMVNTLHGRAVTPPENIVGTYKSPAGEATLYVSVYSSADTAAMVSTAMARRIESGIPPFMHFRVFEKGEHPVFMCLGQGRAHFFFSWKTRLYWLASDIGVAEAAIIALRKEVREQ